jgi:hypothetical protein
VLHLRRFQPSVDRTKEMFRFQNGTGEDRERSIIVLSRLTSNERFQLLPVYPGTPSLPLPWPPQPGFA